MTALITGASSGIGLELARLFAENGADLVITARRQERLEALAAELRQKHHVAVRVIVADLADPQAPQAIYDELKQASVRVDVLVNNAGFGAYGYFGELDLANQLEMLQVNVLALTSLTYLFLPQMLAYQTGKILNVASTAGFIPGPLNAIYYASKAFVVSFSQALAAELKGSGVTVTALCPGLTHTEFHQRAGMENSGLLKHTFMDARRVAEIGYDALTRGKAVAIPGMFNKLITFAVRWVPRKLLCQVMKSLQEKRRKI